MVGHIMRRSFVAADPDEKLEDVRQTMRMARLRHLLVTRGDQLVGILSYREILESLLAHSGDPAAATAHTVADAMKPAPAFATPETPLAAAADRMVRYGLGCLPVLQARADGSAAAGHLVGIVTEADLLRAAYARR